jgi:hypothetical protein
VISTADAACRGPNRACDLAGHAGGAGAGRPACRLSAALACGMILAGRSTAAGTPGKLAEAFPGPALHGDR